MYKYLGYTPRIMKYAIGLVLALLVSLFARLVGFDRDCSFYPVVLIVIASYYFLFAVMGGSIRRESLSRWIAARDAELARYMTRPEAVPALGLKNATLVRVAAAGAMRYVEGPDQNARVPEIRSSTDSEKRGWTNCSPA